MRRKRLLAGMLLILLLIPAAVASAQDELPPELEAEVQQTIERAQAMLDFAFNLLGIFEAVSVAITIVGALFGAFGFIRLISAQNSLTKAREDVEREITNIRAQFDADLARRREEFEQLSQQLLQAVEEQRKDAANATANAALATALLGFGERQFKAADFNGAVDTYKRALNLDDNNPVTYYKLGYAYSQMGELDDAETYLKKSLEIDEQFNPAKVALGYTYRRKGEKLEEGIERERILNMAEGWMLDGLKASPKLVDEDGESWWGALGGLYKRRSQTDQAVYAYQQAAIVTPNSSYPFNNLANLYGESGDLEAMLKMWGRVERLAAAEVQAEVGNYWGYFDLLTAHLATGQTDKAEDILPAVLGTVPPDAVYALGTLVSTLRKVGELLADYPQSKDLFAFARRIERYREAREQNPEAFALDPVPADTMNIKTTPETE